PIDATTFTANDITVIYRDVTTDGSAGGTPIPVTGITPLLDENSPLTTAQQQQFGASKFLISFAPQSGTGTYSYEIFPSNTTDNTQIQDRLRYKATTASTVVNGNLVDENGNALTNETPA